MSSPFVEGTALVIFIEVFGVDAQSTTGNETVSRTTTKMMTTTIPIIEQSRETTDIDEVVDDDDDDIDNIVVFFFAYNRIGRAGGSSEGIEIVF